MRPPKHDDRSRKSEKIIAILQDYLDGQAFQLSCLDVGCSSGVISNHLAEFFSSVVAIDVDIDSTPEKASTRMKSHQALFAEASGEELPFPDQSFDVVVCAQVYEHVNDQQALVSEIHRVIRPGGICFFSGPNRLAIVEEHYWLPFLSWMPHGLASVYMRIFNRGSRYDAYPLFYWQLLRLWEDFEVVDYTLRLLRNPDKYSVNERVRKYPWLDSIPNWILGTLRPLYPNYNWILIKKNGKSQ